MNAKESAENSSNAGQPKVVKWGNRIGCLILIGIGGFFFLAYFPGFLAYQDQKKRDAALPFLEKIQSSLNSYAESQQNKSFPPKIANYEDLYEIVSMAHGSIPNNQSETNISSLEYERIDSGSYILRVNIEGNERIFYILYPAGVIQINPMNSIDRNSAMSLIKAVLYMDQALMKKDFTKYFDFYSPKATIEIQHSIYKDLPTGPKQEKLETRSFTDIDLFMKFLMDVYRSGTITDRKRKQLSIQKIEENWKVTSGYNETGDIKGKSYRKEGQSIYLMSQDNKTGMIVNDQSFARLYLTDSK